MTAQATPPGATDGPAVTPARNAAAPPGELSRPAYRALVAGATGAVAAVLLARLTAWPPHEDEALALVVGHGSLGDVLHTVLRERGGAPLHFLVAWADAHLGGGLRGLRLASAVFAAASVPVVAAVGARLAGRTAGAIACWLAAGSWMLLFHGIYGRMYSLFLVTSALSYLALMRARETGRTKDWAAWVAAVLLTVAAHPYGALVVASQGAYVLGSRRDVRRAIGPFAAVAVLGLPFWVTDLVLAGRFDVGVGPGGEKLGDPLSVLRYLAHVAGDFTAGWPPAIALALAAAGLGAVRLARRDRDAALLAAAAFAVPVAAFLAARLGRSTAPETRHLIFVLPFFATLAALPLADLARSGRRAAAAAILAAAVALEVGWAWDKTPPLFTGDLGGRAADRAAAARWLAATGRPNDVLLGYDPIFLGAIERSGRFSRLVLPRADPSLAARELEDAPKPLGRGIWVFDAYDTNNLVPQPRVELRLPRPAGAFEARAFGSYLVVRTRGETRTPARYLARAAAAQVVGHSLGIGDADVNFDTLSRAARRLGYPSSRASSRSTSSR